LLSLFTFIIDHSTSNNQQHNTMAATTSQAIKLFEQKNEISAAEAKEINLCNQNLVKLDTKVLSTLSSCEKLSLSTNSIERMVSLSGMTELKILSLGRNNLKKIEKASTLPNVLVWLLNELFVHWFCTFTSKY